MSSRKCPECGSPKTSTERRIDGDSLCLGCGHKWKTSTEPIVNSFQSYLSDCECSGGMIMVNGTPVCRWCRKPYAKGAMINYTNEQASRGLK